MKLDKRRKKLFETQQRFKIHVDHILPRGNCLPDEAVPFIADWFPANLFSVEFIIQEYVKRDCLNKSSFWKKDAGRNPAWQSYNLKCRFDFVEPIQRQTHLIINKDLSGL